MAADFSFNIYKATVTRSNSEHSVIHAVFSISCFIFPSTHIPVAKACTCLYEIMHVTVNVIDPCHSISAPRDFHGNLTQYIYTTNTMLHFYYQHVKA